MLKDIFEEWSKNLFAEPLKAAIHHRLTVKFSNDKGVEKTIQVLPTKSGPGIFGARLTEGGTTSVTSNCSSLKTHQKAGWVVTGCRSSLTTTRH